MHEEVVLYRTFDNTKLHLLGRRGIITQDHPTHPEVEIDGHKYRLIHSHLQRVRPIREKQAIIRKAVKEGMDE